MTHATDGGQLMPMEETLRLGEIFTRSGYFRGIRDEAQAIVKILYGRELGFSPVASMMGIHIVEGKPELGANMLAALVKQSGRYDYQVTEHTDQVCAIAFTQDGQETGTSAFSMDDARRANLVRSGSGWEKYPRAMLFARALSQGVRTYCPDVAAGVPVYAPGEIGGGKDPDPEPAAPAMVTMTRETPREAGEATSTQPPFRELIGADRQRALHREFREALGPDLRALADNGMRALLTEHGYLKTDKQGRDRPSTAVIPVDEYARFRAAVLDRARTFNETGRAA